MAQKLDYNQAFNDLRQYVPKNLRNETNLGLLDNLFNRFLTKDESIPFFGYVGRKPTGDEDPTPRLPEINPERDINAVTPVLNFKVGSEMFAFTVQDLLNKAKVLGIDTDDLAWLYSQGNNFRPPIDFDRFTNFFNYYWIAKALPATPTLAWNPELEPEYHVISAPLDTDVNKKNVVVATAGQNYVLTGSGFLNQTFTITFTTATDFTVSASGPLLGPNGVYTPVVTSYSLAALPSVPASPVIDVIQDFAFNVTGPNGVFELLTFKIVREPRYNSSNTHIGYTTFDAGDIFTVATSFLSANYTVSFAGTPSTEKAKIGYVRALDEYQTINGVQLRKGDRVLIKNQNVASENGIYVVSEQNWARSTDFNSTTWSNGAKVFVVDGTVQPLTTWTSQGDPSLYGWVLDSATTSNTNDWQEGNYWVKGDQLATLGIDRTTVVQAVRPIIEWDSRLQLNSRVVSGVPAEGASNYRQEKTEFNQLPQFDLFRYDGTHAGLVSSVFYYVEDLGAELDVALQRRVKRSTNDSSDFLFNHGCVDGDGALLFYKLDGALSTVWHAGYLDPQVVDYRFFGIGGGTLTGLGASNATQQQVWTLSAISPTTFEVSGSKVPTVTGGDLYAVVGVPYDNGDISFTINGGPFTVGESFVLRVGNLERPRYVFRADDGSIQDLFGGPAADTDKIGAYQVSRTFINNPYNEVRAEMTEGSVYSHFRGVLAGSPTGFPLDYAFGGGIKLWSEQHTLLASILMQRDVTLVSMIEMAKRQYDVGLNTVSDIFVQKIVEYLSTNETPISGDAASINALTNYILEIRSEDNDVRTVLYDTTSGVTGFPITLPALGLGELVVPTQRYDQVLDQVVLVHHDGHLSSINVDDQTFRDRILGDLVGKTVLRSDGTSTPAVGSFTSIEPANPYKGELWLRPAGTEGSDLLVFAVDFDTNSAPSPLIAGQRWYERLSGVLYESDGANWIAQFDPSVAWQITDLAAVLNDVMLTVEGRLYSAINPNQRRYDFSLIASEPVYQQELQRELFNFAAINGLDPLGTNYDPADAFTYNYSQGVLGNFPALLSPTVPARWYDILKSHQGTVAGVIPTERPNVEPWKLLGYSTFSAWWTTLTGPQQVSFSPVYRPEELTDGTFISAGSVRAVQAELSITPLFGLATIDGINLGNGDRVLLQNEASPANNDIWVVSTGSWTRASTPLIVKTYVTVLEGLTRAGTTWALSAPVVTINVDPVIFSQVREWSTALWTNINGARPTLKISVNKYNDALLPPYVIASSAVAVDALTNALPLGTALPFDFGEGSPVEEVWVRSIEYGYAQAKALARFDPLALLGFAWGFNWVEVDGILYDGFDMGLPGHKRFRLHGEPVSTVTRGAAISWTGSTTLVGDYVVTYDAYDTNRRQNFSVRDLAGNLVATVTEGTTTSLVLPTTVLLGFTIEDQGIPFRIGDRFIISLGTSSPATFEPVTSYRYLGLGQTFTNALREIAISTENSYAISAFRGWDVNMGYRAGGLVATDDLQVYTEGETLGENAYTLFFKKNEIAKDLWLQALRVTVLQYGSFANASSYQQDGIQYRGNPTGEPAGSADDWVFRIEGYNPRYSDITYYDLATIGSGTAFPYVAVIGQRFFRHDVGVTYEFNGVDWIEVTQNDLVTFSALDKSGTDLQWFQPTTIVSTVSTMLPITITGLQNLNTFMFGYARYLEDAGWSFNTANEFNIDAETGRHRTWQLEIEKLVDRVYRGIQIGEGHVMNPFMDRVWVRQDTGMLSQFRDTALFDITGDAGVFDVLGIRMEATDLTPIRGNLTSSIGSTVPMYSVHAQLDEFEHLFIFNQYVEQSTENGLLYDPFSGSRVITYKFNGRAQGNRTFRPELGGYYISDGAVRLNMQASTDNLERLYDANYAFENQLTSKHAFALLGFNTKSYFDDLDISNKTQFNFWRGLVHAKGTNMSIEAYLNSNRFRDAQIDEYWAYKVATYGDARQLSYPEMKLRVADTQQQFTQLQFDAVPGTELVNFTQISRIDEARWFSIDDLDQDAFFKAEAVGSFVKNVLAGEVVVLPFIADKLIIAGDATQINSSTLLVGPVGGLLTVVGYGPAVPRYNPIKLFNYVADELVEEIPHWHPAAGQHAPTALESINVIGPTNPAHYNYSTLVENNNSFDPLRPWGENELGRVWFDTRNLAYVPYSDATVFPNRGERLSRWGTIADYATIDIYEWVKSSVPPTEYNALAQIEAIDADIRDSEKASGEVALQETYSRDRTWFIRPVAWSQTGTLAGGHPSFVGSFNSKLYVNGTVYSLELGTFGERGITAGSRIGAWNPDPADPKPLSEAIVTNQFTKQILYDGAAFTIQNNGVGIASTVNVTVSSYTEQTGQLVFAAEPVIGVPRSDPDGVIVGYDFTMAIRVTDFDTGLQTVVVLDTVFNELNSLPTVAISAGQTFSYDIQRFGLTISLTAAIDGVVPADSVLLGLVDTLDAHISTRDAVIVIPVVAFDAAIPDPTVFSNDTNDVENIDNDGIGWVAWTVPTQLQLTADGKQPYSIWKPYAGNATAFSPSQDELAAAIAYVEAPLTLNNGSVVERFVTGWSDWSLLKDTVYEKVQTGVDAPIAFTHFENIDPIRTTVYINGIAQLKAAYTIVGTVLTINSVKTGHYARVIIRKYSPTTAELEFNPDVADDLAFQRQYKQDYEYVTQPIRDEDGSIGSSVYYFWVKNRSVIARNKKLSTRSIVQNLRDGPPNYLTFQPGDTGLVQQGTAYGYNAITISGLSYVVAKDDTFKLRFTRNFTLRDDPQQLELKNVHTEWALMRPGQKTKVPEALWNKLVDSMAALDTAGNPVPALRRQLYDERNGTSTQFGFGPEQTLAPFGLLRSSVLYTVLNTRLIDTSGPTPVPDFISVLDFNDKDLWFSTAASTRSTMATIWTGAKVSQINEIFFAALEDVLATNLELTDIFKTSRLSAYSIKVVNPTASVPSYE